MKFKLYQIHLTDAEVDKVNAEGHNSVPKHMTKLDMSFAKDEVGSLAKKAMDNNWYTHVSNITANDINHVFEVGNIGPEENIERLAPMYSVSVSDVVENENGDQFVCASVGWKEVA
tara:strand:+ start:13880 stop:14227 length:348 start_codon:yes stop_codon:yes gene_type:complete